MLSSKLALRTASDNPASDPNNEPNIPEGEVKDCETLEATNAANAQVPIEKLKLPQPYNNSATNKNAAVGWPNIAAIEATVPQAARVRTWFAVSLR